MTTFATSHVSKSVTKPRPTAEEANTQPMAGVWQLCRFILRRDRVRLSIWTGSIAGLVIASTASVTGLYDTQVELDQYGQLVRDNAALIVQAGPGYGLGSPTIGAVMMNELAIWTIIAVAVMSVFMVVRHTRTEEETERAELIRAAPVGRHAPMAATLLAVTIANIIIALSVVLSLLAYDLPIEGSFAFGATMIAAGFVFAAIAVVMSQVADTGRSAIGLACAAIAIAFILRAIGDVGDGRLSWLSPLGWAQAIRAFANERWWVLLLPTATAAVLVYTATQLQARRDIGAGLIGQRLGPATAGRLLNSPVGLSIRLQRASIIGWSIGLGLFAFFYGIVADQAESILEDNPDMEDFFAQFGEASITDVFLTTSILIVAMVASGFTISSALRLRSEERSSRADPILATPTARFRLIVGSVAVTIGGTAIVMATSGLAIGAGFAAMTGDASQILRLFAAAIVMVPALLVIAGVALTLHGVAPKYSPGAWGALGFVFVVGIFGPVLKLPQWLLDVSPFQHVPPLPAGQFELLPVAILVTVAAVLHAFGIAAFHRRDID